jgi:exodeoxyribonuclease VII small subunit
MTRSDPRAAAPAPAAPTGTAPDVAALPFEAALAELESIVKQLEGGRVPLEDSIVIYERGELLKRHCESLLKRAEARIERITLGPDGRPTGTVPLDPA